MLTTISPSSQLHISEAPNLEAQNQNGLVPAPSRKMYAARNIAVATIRAEETLVNPFFLIENESFRVMISSPRKNLIMPFLVRATSGAAAAFRPRNPSETQSMESPVANAMIMHIEVLMWVGMQRIMAGIMLSMI